MPTTEQSQGVKPPRPAQLQSLHPPKPESTGPGGSGDASVEHAHLVGLPDDAAAAELSVHSLDETIAAEASQLAEQANESVNDVLDGVLEDHPAQTGGPAAQAGEGVVIPGSDGGTDSDGGTYIPAARSVVEEVSPAGRGEGEGPAVASVAKAQPEPVAEVAPEPEPEPEQASELAPEPASDPEVKASSTSEPAPAPAPSPASEPAPVAALAGPQVTTVTAAHRFSSWLHPLLSALALMLAAPLRLVPARYRQIVDLVALSLVFWVPIVWTLALLLARR